jgi:alcohol dehydrogenase class IV
MQPTIKDMIRPLAIHFPRKLVFGNGKLDDLAKEVLRQKAKKVLIITI